MSFPLPPNFQLVLNQWHLRIQELGCLFYHLLPLCPSQSRHGLWPVLFPRFSLLSLLPCLSPAAGGGGPQNLISLWHPTNLPSLITFSDPEFLSWPLLQPPLQLRALKYAVLQFFVELCQALCCLRAFVLPSGSLMLVLNLAQITLPSRGFPWTTQPVTFWAPCPALFFPVTGTSLSYVIDSLCIFPLSVSRPGGGAWLLYPSTWVTTQHATVTYLRSFCPLSSPAPSTGLAHPLKGSVSIC